MGRRTPSTVEERCLGEEYGSSQRVGRGVAGDIAGALMDALRPPLGGFNTLSEGLIQLRSTLGTLIPGGYGENYRLRNGLLYGCAIRRMFTPCPHGGSIDWGRGLGGKYQYEWQLPQTDFSFPPLDRLSRLCENSIVTDRPKPRNKKVAKKSHAENEVKGGSQLSNGVEVPVQLGWHLHQYPIDERRLEHPLSARDG